MVFFSQREVKRRKKGIEVLIKILKNFEIRGYNKFITLKIRGPCCASSILHNEGEEGGLTSGENILQMNNLVYPKNLL